MAMVPRLVRQFRRSLQIKKIIANAPRVNSEKSKMVGYKETSDVAKKAAEVAQEKEW